LIHNNFYTIQRIVEREFVEQTIPVRATIKEAIDIFYVVNASGVNLTEAELALAQISGYWPDARDLFKAKLRDMAQHGFVFKLDFLVYVMLGVLHQSGSDMRKLHTPDNSPKIKEAWEMLANRTLDYVINILKTHAYVDHTKEINSVYALVPIIVYCFNKGKKPLSQVEIKKIVKWFYYSQIRQRYISQMPQKLDKDNGIVARSETPFDDLINLISIDRSLIISTDEFVGADTRNALWSLMRWYFKSRNAVCFSTGIGIQKNMGYHYALEWDHIFAYSLLREHGYSQNNRLKYAMAQEIANRAVLTRTANRSKSNQEAKGYLTEVQANFPDALKRQSIPLDSELWTLENFEKFLAERRKMLAQELTAFLENITQTSDTAVETSLEDLIREGESAELEFKSSLRWGYKEAALNKKLEDVVMKSIAAFSNGEGGTLLIGINDEGEVLGLDNDYTTLDGTKDEFELHLRNLAMKYFGEGFATSNLTITFPTMGDKEVCKIDIKRALQPKYLEVRDNHGNRSNKFYVRSGNSSIELPITEVTNYIQSRFS
ncbi:MAG TPA: RNA-binding domain-containing protein, partial [Trichocoleus sp.]